MQTARNRDISSGRKIKSIPLLNREPRLLGFLLGGLGRDPAADTKYGLFFQALKRRFNLVACYDLSLQGYSRFWAAALNFHPNRRMWKERYYKNLYAFNQRSRNAIHIQQSLFGEVDFVIQVGVLFDAYWSRMPASNLIYTDYTARLSAMSPYRFRSPLSGAKLTKWLDYESRAFQHAKHIFTRSEFVRKDIVEFYGISKEKVSAVGGGVNFDPFPFPKSPHPGKSPMFFFVGSEFMRKGGDLLLRAFAFVRERYPNACLRILTRDSIPAYLPLENVEIIPYVWNRLKISCFYEEADVFVHPAREETWGDVLLEAAAYGVPSIGVSGGAMDEIIKNGETGILIPPEDVEALANAMIVLLKNVDLRISYGAAARTRAESYFTWDRVVDRMSTTIESIFRKE
jgi:starch synthase